MRSPSLSALLIVMGSLLVLAPLLVEGGVALKNQDRIAEFYARYGNSAVLPEAMRPYSPGVYGWACGVVGVGMAIVGVCVGLGTSMVGRRSASSATNDD